MRLASQICFPLVANNKHVVHKFEVILRYIPKVKVEPLHESCYNQIHICPCQAVRKLAHLGRLSLGGQGALSSYREGDYSLHSEAYP